MTFLFTDVEGSTKMWGHDPDRTEDVIVEHESLLGRHVVANGGLVVKGMGDGILAVFDSAIGAVSAATDIQLDMIDSQLGLKVRVAVDTGEADIRHGDYYGLVLSRCSRVLAAAHGGQIVLTQATERVLPRKLRGGVRLTDLGLYQLRDIDEPIRIFQVTHPALKSDYPRLRVVEMGSHNLPIRVANFIGRRSELKTVARLLSKDRILTLTGVGGGGKSSLAIQLARDHLDDFPGGVWLVELAAVKDDDRVIRAIAQSLGIPEEPGRTDLEALELRLQDDAMLLILDNCEQVLTGCAEVTTSLLTSLPNLKILATSRERLGVAGEGVYLVPTMGLPGADDSRSPTRAMRADAVQLFVQRARLADAGFGLTEDNCEQVCRICRAVDGIPLAIELAAGRIGSLTIAEIGQRLTRRLELLAGGARAGSSRHATMRSTLDWSYDLLSDAEQALLAQLAVFQGSFELDGAESVCDVEGTKFLDAVVALREKSLVTLDSATGRYKMLEPIRHYAWDKLAQQRLEAEYSRRHAEFFANLVEEASLELRGRDQGSWLQRLEDEHDNLRAALNWSLEADPRLALRLASGAGHFWRLHSHLTEGRDWLVRAIEASMDPPPAVLAEALYGAGTLAVAQGDYGPGKGYLQRSLELSNESNNHRVAAAALFGLASLKHRDGELRQATRLFESALERARRAEDASQAGHVLSSLALIYEDQGRWPEGEQSATEALTLARQTGDVYLTADALLALGEIRINRGDVDSARSCLNEALGMAREVGITHVESWASAYLGKAALATSDTAEGERLLSESLAAFQDLGSPAGIAWAMRHLGRAAMLGDDFSRAKALLKEALRIAVEQVRPDAPLVLQALSELEAHAGNWDQAARLAGAAEATLSAWGLELPPAEREWAQASQNDVRAQLGQERYHEIAETAGSIPMEDWV